MKSELFSHSFNNTKPNGQKFELPWRIIFAVTALPVSAVEIALQAIDRVFKSNSTEAFVNFFKTLPGRYISTIAGMAAVQFSAVAVHNAYADKASEPNHPAAVAQAVVDDNNFEYCHEQFAEYLQDRINLLTKLGVAYYHSGQAKTGEDCLYVATLLQIDLGNAAYLVETGKGKSDEQIISDFKQSVNDRIKENIEELKNIDLAGLSGDVGINTNPLVEKDLEAAKQSIPSTAINFVEAKGIKSGLMWVDPRRLESPAR